VLFRSTEGEDKPLKYPDLFAASTLMVLNKIDLLPHVRFDVDRCIALARQVNLSIQVIQVSATTGQGMDDWLHWLEHRVPALAHGHHHGHAHDHSHDTPATEAALRQRVAELEAELARLKSTA
jgi:hydrogenase nickel incorporation protein HypB